MLKKRVVPVQKSSAGRSGEVRSSADTPQMAGKTTVVIIDDRATNRRIMSELASVLEENLKVKAFEDPLVALAWVEDNTPDLVITDYKMPNIDGAEFVRRFRRLPFCFDVPVVVVTVYEDREFRYKALEAGATDFLLSPVDHQEFWSRSRNLLALRRQQQIIKHHAYSLERKLAQSHRLHEETVEEIQERLRSVIDAVPAMIYATDADLRLVFLNSYAAGLTGVTREAAIGSSAKGLFGEAFGRTSEASDFALFTTGEAPPPFEERLVDTHNRVRDMLTTKSALRDPGGRITHAVTAAIDITKLKDAEAARRESEERFREIVENAPVAIGIYDAKGCPVYVNRKFTEVLRYRIDDIPTFDDWERRAYPNEERRNQAFTAWAEDIHHVRSGQAPLSPVREYQITCGDGVVRDIEVNFSLVADHFYVVFNDVTERNRAEHQVRDLLRVQALRDPLTSLYNRRYLDEILVSEFSRAARTQGSIEVVMADIDHFKHFNDTFGHDCGDEVLRVVAQLLRAQFRKSDIVCRYGGEEFTIVMPGATLEQARRRTVRVCEAIRNFEITYGGRAVGPVTMSFGVAAFPRHGDAPDIVLKAADGALLRAKMEGRDRVTVAGELVAPTQPGRTR